MLKNSVLCIHYNGFPATYTPRSENSKFKNHAKYRKFQMSLEFLVNHHILFVRQHLDTTLFSTDTGLHTLLSMTAMCYA